MISDVFFSHESAQYVKIIVTSDCNDVFSTCKTIYCPIAAAGVYVNDFIRKYELARGYMIMIVPVDSDEYFANVYANK